MGGQPFVAVSSSYGVGFIDLRSERCVFRNDRISAAPVLAPDGRAIIALQGYGRAIAAWSVPALGREATWGLPWRARTPYDLLVAFSRDAAILEAVVGCGLSSLLGRPPAPERL